MEQGCPTVGRLCSPAISLEENEVREGDSCLKMHGGKCWAGIQGSGFHNDGLGIF